MWRANPVSIYVFNRLQQRCETCPTPAPPPRTQTPHTEWKFYTVRLTFRPGGWREWSVTSVVPGRAKNRDRLPLVPPVDAEITLVHRNHSMPGIHLAHPNHTQIGQVRLAVGVAPRQFSQLWH